MTSLKCCHFEQTSTFSQGFRCVQCTREYFLQDVGLTQSKHCNNRACFLDNNGDLRYRGICCMIIWAGPRHLVSYHTGINNSNLEVERTDSGAIHSSVFLTRPQGNLYWHTEHLNTESQVMLRCASGCFRWPQVETATGPYSLEMTTGSERIEETPHVWTSPYTVGRRDSPLAHPYNKTTGYCLPEKCKLYENTLLMNNNLCLTWLPQKKLN